MSEKVFRQWLMKQKHDSWFLQTIENATSSGVPDVFICWHGKSLWAELKATQAKTRIYMRISQWTWFRKLLRSGGHGLLMIKRLATDDIDVYNVRELIHAGVETSFSGDDIIFKGDIKPIVTYKLRTRDYKFLDALAIALEKCNLTMYT